MADSMILQELKQELIAERSRRSQLEETAGFPAIVLIDSKGAVTDEGEYLRKNETIDVGSLKGNSVAETDVRRGRLAMADGSILRLSRGRKAESPAAAVAAKPPEWKSPHGEIVRLDTLTEETQANEVIQIENPPPVSFNAGPIRFADLARYLANHAKTTIVVDEATQDRSVNLALYDIPFEEALSLCAKQAGAEVYRRGRVWFVGPRSPQDETYTVLRVRHSDNASVRTAIMNASKVTATPIGDDGTMILTGTHEELQIAKKLSLQLKDRLPKQWAVQLYLFTLSRRDLDELGIDAAPAASFGARADYPNFDPKQAIKASVQLSATLRAAQERSTVKIAARPYFLMIDGETTNFTRGARVPIPRKTVSNQGTVTVTGYDFAQSGTQIKLDLRELSPDLCRLSLNLSLSELTEITADGAPVTQERTYTNSALCTHGGAYLIGSFDLNSTRKARGSWLHSGFVDDTSQELLMIWARVAATDGGPAVEVIQ